MEAWCEKGRAYEVTTAQAASGTMSQISGRRVTCLLKRQKKWRGVASQSLVWEIRPT